MMNIQQGTKHPSVSPPVQGSSGQAQPRHTYQNQGNLSLRADNFASAVQSTAYTPQIGGLLPAAGSPHDMSKQHYQPVLPGPQNMPAFVPQQQPVYYQQRQQYQQFVPAPRQRQPSPQPVPSPGVQGQQAVRVPYYQIQSTNQPVYIQAGQVQGQPQTQLVLPQVQQLQIQRPYAPQQQYNQQATYASVPAGQAQFNAPNTMNQINNPTVYFNSQGQPAPAQVQQRPSSVGAAEQATATPQPYQKRERKGLAIVDPSTGKDVDVGSKTDTPPLSGNSSARDTPVLASSPPPNQEPPADGAQVVAQFAAQVAATLTVTPQAPDTTASPEVQQAETSQPETVVPLVSEEMPPVPTVVEEKPEVVISAETPPVAQDTPTSTGELEQTDEPTQADKPTHVHIPAQVDEPTHADIPAQVDEPTPESTVSELDVESREVSTEEVVKLGDAEVCETVVDASPSPPSTEENVTQTAAEAGTIRVSESNEKTEPDSAKREDTQAIQLETRTSQPESSDGVDSDNNSLTPEVHHPVVDNVPSPVVVPQTSPPVELAAEPQPAVDVSSQPSPPTEPFAAPEIASQSHDSLSSKETLDDVRKQSKKQKLKELNKRGEQLSGSDMDAFVDAQSPLQPANGDISKEEKEVLKSNLGEEISNDRRTEVNQFELKVVMATPETIKVTKENEKNAGKTVLGTEDDAKDDTTAKKLRYEYKEDQWSPLNPEGKKFYDRQFLLQLQYDDKSIVKPEGLPKLADVILEKPMAPKEIRQPAFSNNTPDFTPRYIKSPRGGGSSSGGVSKRGSQQGRPSREPKKIITIPSFQQDVQLHQAEKAWKPDRKSAKAQDDDESKSTDLNKNVRSILNKLTPQKFQTLVSQVMELKVETEPRLKVVIDLIFEKAIDEPSFSVAYANMCKCIMMMKVPMQDKPGEFVNFRKLLLTRCQREFEKDVAEQQAKAEKEEELKQADTDEKKSRIREEIEEADMKAKRRSIGNIKFIGELFKLKMLTENIMHDCLFKLLKASDEDSLECLCRLLTTIGKDIDTVKAKTRVDQYFARMNQIVEAKKTSSRVKFMLQDIIELRRNNWVPRRDDNNPKTIDQIHKDVAIEAREKQIMIQQISQHPQHKGSRGGPGGPMRGQRVDHGRGGPSSGEDGWTAVTKTSRIDPSKMKISKQQVVDENIQLGPGGRPGFSGWGRGSSGGGVGKQSSQEGDKSAPANRYAPLSQPQDDRSRLGRGSGLSGLDRGRISAGRPKQPQRIPSEDRQAALSAVRNLSQGRRSRDSSRDASGERRDSKPGTPGTSGTPVIADDSSGKSTPTLEPTEEDVRRKTKAIIDEYLHIQDLKEAILCVTEMKSSGTTYIHVFVHSALNNVLERSEKARQQTGLLLHHCVKQNLVSIESYLKGLKEILEFAEDMEIDVPKIWVYLGELIGPMVQDGCVPMSSLKEACQPLIPNNKAAPLVAAALHNASHQLGHIKVGDLWKASKVQWSDFFPSGANIQEFIKKNALEFTIDGDHHARTAMPMDKIQEHLDVLLVQKRLDNEVVFDWIEENVTEDLTKDTKFVRALMTSACKSAISEKDTPPKVEEREICRRSVLLQKYLENKAQFELQALYALQALVHSYDHPSKMLQRFFDTLYDEDIISEEAFNQWDSSNEPTEQEGKGVARNSVVQFFTWLREAETEPTDES